jgi:hypothetical protein
MGFNRRKMEDERRRVAEKEAANRRATDPQILEDAERLIAAWNERQAKHHADAVFANDRRCHRSPLLVLRALDRHRDAAVTSLIPMLSCDTKRPLNPIPPPLNPCCNQS